MTGHLRYNSSQLRIEAARLSRSELFAGLFVLGCANGFASRVGQSLDEHGWIDAVFNTFNISVIVLFSCASGIFLVYRQGMTGVRLADMAVASIFLVLVVLPLVSLSWLAVTILSIYIIAFTDKVQSDRRGAIILLAATVPMLWSPLLFDFLSKYILEFDASLVALILGTHRTDNMVEFADHTTSLVIWPACSSIANVSLAFLCWVSVSQAVQHKWHPRDLMWCALSCVSVVAVNVVRMSLMGVDLAYYATIHSPVGDALTGSIIFFVTLTITGLGLRHELFARR